MSTPRVLAALLCCVLMTSCAALPDPAARGPAAAGQPSTGVEVPERFVTDPSPADELDSLATWTTDDGQVRVIATAKSSHRLVIYDGASGERLQEIGGAGSSLRFIRPNGIMVYAALVFRNESVAPGG